LLQLWNDTTTPWGSIDSPFNISKWTLKTDSTVALDLDEYLFPAAEQPGMIITQILPYARSPITQEEYAAQFDPNIEFENQRFDSISVQLQSDPSLECPITGASFSSDVRSPGPLRIGDSLNVTFSAANPPLRVKICGRYLDHPLSTNGFPGQYNFLHTVRSTDSSGPCSLSLYLSPDESGVVPVYTQDTGFVVFPGTLLFERKIAHCCDCCRTRVSVRQRSGLH